MNPSQEVSMSLFLICQTWSINPSFLPIHPQLTILSSGQCLRRWSPRGKCPQTPFCFRRGSGPGRKACCRSQTSSRTPLWPSAARPYRTVTGWSDCQCWAEKVWTDEGEKQVQLLRQMAALTIWPSRFYFKLHYCHEELLKYLHIVRIHESIRFFGCSPTQRFQNVSLLGTTFKKRTLVLKLCWNTQK